MNDSGKVHEAWRDLLFIISYVIGIIRLIKKMPGLKLKDWVKSRLKNHE